MKIASQAGTCRQQLDVADGSERHSEAGVSDPIRIGFAPNVSGF